MRLGSKNSTVRTPRDDKHILDHQDTIDYSEEDDFEYEDEDGVMPLHGKPTLINIYYTIHI